MALPSSLIEDLSDFQVSNLSFKMDTVFYPHISTEAPPNIVLYAQTHLYNETGQNSLQSKSGSAGYFQQDRVSRKTDDSYSSQALYLLKQFSLSLYQIQL